MSMKRFGKAAYRIANELVAKGGRLPIFQRFLPRIFPATYNLGVHVVLKKAPFPRQNALRIARLVTRHGRVFRPFSSVIIERHRFQNQNDWRRKFQPIRKELPRNVDLVERIRQIFGNSLRYNEDLKSTEWPNRIDSYEFGEFLGQGCNAAVYSARLANSDAESSGNTHYGAGFNEVTNILAEIPPVSKVAQKKFPLAIKLMFNFEHDRDGDAHLLKSMGNELAPYPNAAKLLNGQMGTFRPLPAKHPNVVRIQTAFIDSLKVLPDAIERYPDALHTARWYESIASEPKTMYVVMRRYRQTLHEYVWTRHRNYWTGRVIIAQLLEACTYLHKHKVAQRDMKSDNILLEYDFDDEIPQLVVADFGCALACDNWQVDYESDEVSLGGNAKTKAPEIATAVPGKNVKVNFEMADTWAAGGLSYEVLTRSNPFYKLLDTATYQESELPALPSRVNFVARDVIFDLLKRDPNERVKPNIAANALNLSLFRMGEDVKQMMEKCGISQMTTLLAGSSKVLSQKINSRLDKVMNLITAETIMANLAPHLISRAERQLRATFLSRMNREDIWRSLQYFFPAGVQLDTPATSSDCLETISSLMSSFSNDSENYEKQQKPAKNGYNNVPLLLRNVIRTDADGINGIVHRVRSK
ncbi:Serine/threonine-protein kinase pink-1, mitochondrial [Caenorhabditis elegans]|uniref:Serine/threonine-protein kinase pink-1, mitochondrial n=2 Tax=Caenorhabditis elegans TaxID=6239 RepID=PINK1_CAEEL|nr:Serine/threonine-protein kinase pink-1, mitochondrial [Caenorhabditis elegans]Q09298.2 RecName: Full=Serine/threonine-protein kinase pink-1, mitochondrial; AltName: Full=PTEN-induced kinase 1 homolog; Flags: Precursor [Caenorhabditis elegans]CCD68737.1 Serine/threonine-protein kinase pink-1, mitochondrial [Caenorhabditis elegans]|eukprot:NP_495017.1 Serine/threonine-protein kinase pink-1, mitochondrial [Caenorhabditis elegans]